MSLQQSYAFAVAERVTGPHETALIALNTKYKAGLERTIAEAKAAGKLEAIIALEAEIKRLADKLPIPSSDDETEPESLKKFRGIYRQQLTELTAARDKNQAALLAPFTAKLQELEASLVKSDRVDEAKEVLAYRQGLGMSTPSTPAPTAATTPAAPTPAASMPDVPKVKGDDRKAAEWVRSLGEKHKLVTDEGKTITTLADIPKGKFALTVIQIDGRSVNEPVTAESLKVLSGLGKLVELHITHTKLPDEAFDFLATLPALETLKIEDTGSTDSVVGKAAACKSLKRVEFVELPQFTGAALGQLKDLRQLSELRCYKTALNDAGITGIGQLTKLVQLVIDGHREITDVSLPHLQPLKSLASLFVGGNGMTAQSLATLKLPNLTNISFNKLDQQVMRETAPVLASAFPKIIEIDITYDVATPEDLASLGKFPKLNYIESWGDISEAAMAGLSACGTLLRFRSPSTQKLTDGHLRGLAGCASLEEISIANSEITDAGLLMLVPMKKLKFVTIKSPALTDAGVAAFKKLRKDIRVEK